MNLSTVSLFKHLNNENTIKIEGENLDRLQKVLLKIMDDIDLVCRKHNITYMLGGGSALGAVRHNGFIPWDDDIDINMCRLDYKRFIPLFKKEFGYKYWVHTPEDTEGHGILLARIRLKDTIVRNRDDIQSKECGAFVDIFIVENTFNSVILRTVHGFGSLMFGFCLSCRRFFRDRKTLWTLADSSPSIKKIFAAKILFGALTAILSIDRWTCLNIWWNALCKDSKSNFVVIPAGRRHFFGEIYPRKSFSHVIPKSFENREYYVSVEVHQYLKALYGDYMKIPPPEQREAHTVLEFQL